MLKWGLFLINKHYFFTSAILDYNIYVKLYYITFIKIYRNPYMHWSIIMQLIRKVTKNISLRNNDFSHYGTNEWFACNKKIIVFLSHLFSFNTYYVFVKILQIVLLDISQCDVQEFNCSAVNMDQIRSINVLFLFFFFLSSSSISSLTIY